MEWPVTAPVRPEEAASALSALRTVLGSSGELSEPRGEWFETLRSWLGVQSSPGAVDPASAAEAIDSSAVREYLLDAMVIGVLVDGAATEAEVASIRSYAAALGVDAEVGARTVELFVQRRTWRLRAWVMSRFWPLERIRAQIRERGFLRRMVPFVLAAVFGQWRHAATARRYAALRELPEGTLGRELVDYFAANEFPLYGERGAIDELIVFHDYSHVLAGYGTFPAHEILTAWFMAGYRRVDLPLMLFPLLQFHLGVMLNPVAPACHGLFDAPSALEALLRGVATTTDLTRDWDFWPLVAEPLHDVRRDLNVLPSVLLDSDNHLHPERIHAA